MYQLLLTRPADMAFVGGNRRYGLVLGDVCSTLWHGDVIAL